MGNRTVIYDGDCGICELTRRVVTALDWLRLLRWIPLQSAEAGTFGIPVERLEAAAHLVTSRRVIAGFPAVRAILLRLPLTYAVIAFSIWLSPWAALPFAFFFSPLARPLGQAGYDWVARNRYRVPGSTCDNRIK
jgi:predicted DCC family thiol-disulfide oxidoreductase YuxK